MLGHLNNAMAQAAGYFKGAEKQQEQSKALHEKNRELERFKRAFGLMVQKANESEKGKMS